MLSYVFLEKGQTLHNPSERLREYSLASVGVRFVDLITNNSHFLCIKLSDHSNELDIDGGF